MSNLKSLFTRALLALSLACGAGAAAAAPTYHVAIDTATLAGTTGYLDLAFIGTGTAAPATATVTNFAGNFGATSVLEGDASGSVGSAVVLGNSTFFNDFLQSLNFGGLFSFDVSFDVGAGIDGTSFGIGLLDDNFGYPAGISGNIADIALTPGAADVVSPPNALVTVSVAAAQVPEPGVWLLLLTGLLLLTYTQHRRAGS